MESVSSTSCHFSKIARSLSKIRQFSFLVNSLSLTLRDAQHLCWKTFKKFEMVNQKGSAAFESADYLKAKVEEISKKLNPETGLHISSRRELSAKLLSELIFSVFVIAEKEGVSLEESFLQTVDEMILSLVS